MSQPENEDDGGSSRTELDSHANMMVVGRNSYIINTTGKTANVRAFSPDLPGLDIPIVDAALLYECPFEGTCSILLCPNALHVPTMAHNLIPPFIMREAGIVVNDVPKIQVAHPDVTDHSLYFPSAEVRIPLALWGIFSYFPTRRPTRQDLQHDDQNVLLLTPEGPWNPQSDAYARNEENLLDWEGNIVPTSSRQQILLAEVEGDEEMDLGIQVHAIEASAIDELDKHRPPMGVPIAKPPWDSVPTELDEWNTQLASVNPTLSSSYFAGSLDERHTLSDFYISAGATDAWLHDTLFPDQDEDDIKCLDDIDLDEYMACSADASSTKGVTAEHLSKVWRIDHKTAERTINVTTQRCVRSETDSLSRNYQTNDRMLRYRRIHQHFFMDTFFATKQAHKSSRGHTCMQLFVTDKGFVYVVPLKNRGEVPQALKAFAKEIGAPDAIICDAAREQISHEIRSFCHKIGTTLRVLEKDTPWSNRAELYIGIIKEAIRKDMKASDCPLAFWDFCAERRARINNLTAKDLFQLDGQTAHFSVTGQEGDISNLCQFDWYEWVYYREGSSQFPLPREILGRSLGPAKGEGNEMAQWVLKANGNIVPRRSVRPLTTVELTSETEKEKRTAFNELIKTRWGTSISPPQPAKSSDFDPYEDDDENPNPIPEFDDPVDAHGNAIDTQPAYDSLINVELMLQQQDTARPARVIGRSKGADGKVAGTYNSNPILNTITYDVEFDDGEVKEYAANVIAENLLSQVDDEGFSITRLQCIIDHKANEQALTNGNAYTTIKHGTRRLRKTTCGWNLLVRWHDDSEQWIPLRILKESNPVETAEYAKARGLEKEPAFAWWVPYTLRKRAVIVSAVKARTRKTTHKYGIEIPRSVQHAYELDKRNGNDHWAKSIRKEMRNVGVAFEILEPSKSIPPGWSQVSGHLVFDIKMSLERKSRWVLDGHLTDDVTDISTYAGVVSRESVRIALTYAALNNVDVWAADIRNAYLQAPSSRKDYIICGPEFGLENIGRKALIRRALYGGKTAGRDFRNHLRACMDHLKYKPCPADPDVWMRPAVKADGAEYWEYVLLYTDDTLVISERGEQVLRNEIGKYFELKEESIGPPDIYLGGKLRKVQLENGIHAWAFGSSQYVQAAVKNVESYLRERHLQLPTKANTPLPSSYRPELDVTPELSQSDAAHYQSLIGTLRWIVELGRVDIFCEVSMMSSHLALPREGHLNGVYSIFAFLKRHHNAEMVFDPSDPDIDLSLFERQDWSASEMGLCVQEELPPNMPRPRGLGFIMRAFVDADHATDSVTRRSRTGFLVYLNSAMVYWLSKKQACVETSSFGSEFTAMKQCAEYVRGLRYKLRMMGIPCGEPTLIYGDNQSVLYNTSLPDSTLKKKSHSIAYHFVRGGAARDEWRTAYINTHLNPADLLTKPLPHGEKRIGFVRMMLHHIYGNPQVE